MNLSRLEQRRSDMDYFELSTVERVGYLRRLTDHSQRRELYHLGRAERHANLAVRCACAGLAFVVTLAIVAVLNR